MSMLAHSMLLVFLYGCSLAFTDEEEGVVLFVEMQQHQLEPIEWEPLLIDFNPPHAHAFAQSVVMSRGEERRLKREVKPARLDAAVAPEIEPVAEVRPPREIARTEAIHYVAPPVQAIAHAPIPRLGSAISIDIPAVSLPAVAAGEGTASSTDGDIGQGDQGTKFFGVNARGNKFVFVIDSSQSMQGEKWQTACREVIAAVGRLDEKDFFYVILFDGIAHRMFTDHSPEPLPLAATEENLRKLAEWLRGVEHGSGKETLVAIRHAVVMRPSAIFLLTDDTISDSTLAYLRSKNKAMGHQGELMPQVAVHTVCLHNQAAETQLRKMAEENSGTFHFVPDPRFATIPHMLAPR